MRPILLPVCVFLLCQQLHAQIRQDSSLTTPSGGLTAETVKLDPRSLTRLNAAFGELNQSLQKRTEGLLVSAGQREAGLQRLVARKDSSKAQQLFSSAKMDYQALRDKLNSPLPAGAPSPLKEYIPNVDSIATALKFLQLPNINLPNGQLQQVQALSVQFQQLQGNFQKAADVQSFVQQRQQQFRAQLENYGGSVSKAILGMNKQVYYYQAQVAAYKETLKDPDKMQAAVINAARQTSTFNNFMARNSILAQLYPPSANYGTPQALNGLQTMNDIKKGLQDRFGKNALSPESAGGSSPLDNGVQSAQSSLSQLKDRIMAAGGNSSDMTIPEFAPNQQKSKSFLKRLEYGFNIQTQPGTSFLPVTSDVGISVGYKLSDKATIGTGVSYMVGWGSALNNIHVTNQGVGLRSFLDIKAKGSIWVTAGWEYNYYQAFSKLSDLRDPDIWQKSALIGLAKKYKIGARSGNIQLLYDLLAGQQIPAVPALKFRVGYSF